MLSELKDEHIGKLSFLSTYSSDDAIDIIFDYDSKIEEVSNELEIPKEMIQAILYRELIFNNAKDLASDAIVMNYHACRLGYGTPVINNIQEWVYGKLGDDSSTGIGQIFARTAIRAENMVNGNMNISTNNEDDVWEMWQKLRNNETNIYYVGLVMKMEAQNNGIDISDVSLDEIKTVFAGYNGGADAYLSKDAQTYAVQTMEYYELFKQYEVK